MSNSDNRNQSKPNGITTQPLPASQKAYVHSHEQPDISVPMRAITLSDDHGGNGHANTPVMVYDTSGPYTDPSVTTDIRAGLRPVRWEWIKARRDVEEVPRSYVNGNGKNGSHTESFPETSRRPILRSKAGCNVSQMHYARKGIITPEMEYIAIRENIGRRAALSESTSAIW